MPYRAAQSSQDVPLVDVWTSPQGLEVRLLPAPSTNPDAYPTLPPYDRPVPDYEVVVTRPGPRATVDRDAPTTDLLG